ncbi:MAG: hypothetical protein U1F43_13535 [Myxococcota bacterium]
MRSDASGRGVAAALIAALAGVALAASGCGTSAQHGFLIPGPSGNDRQPLGSGTISIERLIERAAAELEAGHRAPGAAAERWVRWALVRQPGHPGALVVAARLAIARGDRAEARRLFALAARSAPKEVAGEQAKNLAALAQAEADDGRVASAARLVAELEEELPEPMKALRLERANLHRALAAAWLDKNLREPARAELATATRLGEDTRLLDLRLDALDKGALQQSRARSTIERAPEWRALARWLGRFGRPEDAEWALGEAREDASGDADMADNDVLGAEMALAKQLAGEARDLWLKAAARLQPAAGARVLMAGARALEAEKHHDEALALVGEAKARLPQALPDEAAQAQRKALEAALDPLLRGVQDPAVEAKAIAALRAWSEPDADALVEWLRALERRPVPELRAALGEARKARAAAGREGLLEPAWDALGDAYAKLKRWPESVAAYEAALTAHATGATPEIVAIRFRSEERGEEAMRFYDRMHPAEIQQTDVLPELTRRYVMRADRRGAEAMARRFLELGASHEVQPARTLALAELLVELRLSALAAEAYELVVESGDKTTETYCGWVRALLRQGDDEAADKVANRLLGDRAKKDVRALDELGKVFSEEGRLARAADLLTARLADGDRFEAGVMSPLADLLRRTGRTAELVPLVERFVAADARSPQRAYQTGAQRLVEAGLSAEARDLLARGLEVRPKDPTLLSSALSVAILRQDTAAVDALARRLFNATPAGSAVDVFERVIGDVRAGIGPEVALGLADDALQRVPGAARLLVARGRIQLLAGREDAAFQDFADAIARSTSGSSGAGTAREVLDAIEPLLRSAHQLDLLIALEARALAQTPGRADVVVPYGKALIDVGRIDEAEQVFARFLADNDRGHSVVAQAWYDAGKYRRALDHWSKGMDQLTDIDAPAVLAAVATSLAQIGEPERLDPFVRLYIQVQDGAGARTAPALWPIAQAYATVGRADDALAWLRKAEAATPTADIAFELGKALLARNDRAGALAAFERTIARRAAEALPTQSTAWFAGGAAAPVVALLLSEGRPEAADAARALVARVEGQYGASGWTRLLGARAAVAQGELGAALERMSGPWAPWRSSRDLMPILRALLSYLMLRGHGEAAQAVVSAAVDAGPERELIMAALRIGGDAGHPVLAFQAAARLWGELPAAQAWVAAEALATAGLEAEARPWLGEALRVTPAGPALTQAANAEVLLGTPIDEVMAGARAVRQDAVERATLAFWLQLGDVGAAGSEARAFDAMRPLLAQSLPDRALVARVLVAAALAGDGRAHPALAAALDAISSGNADRAAWLRQTGATLADNDLPGAGLDALDRLAATDGGDGALALQAIELALSAGAPERATAWAARVPKGAQRDLNDLYLRLERPDLIVVGDAPAPSGGVAATPALTGMAAARLAAARLVKGPGASAAATADQWLEATAEEEADRAACAELALARSGVGEGWPTLGRRCLEPFVAEGGAPQRVLELALALAWLDGQTAEARARQAELTRRFPGPFARAAARRGGRPGGRRRGAAGAVRGAAGHERRRARALRGARADQRRDARAPRGARRARGARAGAAGRRPRRGRAPDRGGAGARRRARRARRPRRRGSVRRGAWRCRPCWRARWPRRTRPRPRPSWPRPVGARPSPTSSTSTAAPRSSRSGPCWPARGPRSRWRGASSIARPRSTSARSPRRRRPTRGATA